MVQKSKEMKLIRVFCAIALAAVVFTSCKKEELETENSGNCYVKTVIVKTDENGAFSLENFKVFDQLDLVLDISKKSNQDWVSISHSNSLFRMSSHYKKDGISGHWIYGEDDYENSFDKIVYWCVNISYVYSNGDATYYPIYGVNSDNEYFYGWVKLKGSTIEFVINKTPNETLPLGVKN